MREGEPEEVQLRPPARVLRDHEQGEDAYEMVRRVYLQCLWLGEAHTPLRAFLELLESVQSGAYHLVHLVRTPAEIRARFPAWARERLLDLHEKRGESSVPHDHEAAAMHAALTLGPLARTLPQDPSALAQFLQLVLLAWLLARKRQGDPHLAHEGEAPKAKRKSSKPRRWTGMAPALPFSFLWDTKKSRKGRADQKNTGDRPEGAEDEAARAATDSPISEVSTPGEAPNSASDAVQPESAPGIVSSTPHSLAVLHDTNSSVHSLSPAPSQRIAMLAQYWDLLGDQLCLLQCAPTSSAGVMYGSAAHIRPVNDERDEAQWLCASVLEPVFSSTLPKECARLRTKCFGPGPVATPAPRRLKRTTSAPSTQPVDKKEPLPTLRTEERTMIRADRKQREVVMPRQLKRSTSVSAAPASAPPNKRKRPASRWGAAAEGHTLVCATPEKPKQLVPQNVFGSVSPSPPPLARAEAIASPTASRFPEPTSPGDKAHTNPLAQSAPSLMEHVLAAESPPRSLSMLDMPSEEEEEEELVIPAWRKSALLPTSLPFAYR